MLDYLVDQNNVEIDTEEVKLIKSLIQGEYFHPRLAGNEWTYQIVANKSNSLDVDKFDYICRDSFHIGLKSVSFDYDRVFNGVKVLQNEICYNVKDDVNLASVFLSRYKLFKQVYMHKKTVAFSLMYKDVFLASNEYFRFDEVINDMSRYSLLHDGLFNQIEKIEDERLTEAKRIMTEIRKRNVYLCILEILIPEDRKEEIKKLKAEDFVNYQISYEDGDLYPQDIAFDFFSINFGFGNKNPFDSTKFYKNSDPDQSFTLKGKKFSLLVPVQFSESYLRVYLKNPEKVKK